MTLQSTPGRFNWAKNMSKIKLLLFCGSLNIGGTERNVVNIAKQIDRSRFDVHVYPYYYGGQLEDELRLHNVPYTIGGLSDYVRNIKVHLEFIRFIKREKPDIIHCFNYPTIYIGTLLGRLAGISKVIVAIQAWDTWKSKSQILLDKMLRPFVDLYIADSEGAKRFAIGQQNLNPDKVLTLYDGVDMANLQNSKDVATLRNKLGIANNYPIVGVVARLQDEHKGQSFFIKAIPLILKEFPNTNFLIVGDGKDRGYLEGLSKEIGVKDKVIFDGFRIDLANILSIIDILVIPSVQWESITKTMLEAMAMARPVVATRIGDVEEIIEAGINGLLIPPKSPEEIAKAVKHLLLDRAFAERLGERAAETILAKNLTLEKSIELLEQIYISMLSKRASLFKKVSRWVSFGIVFILILFGVYALNNPVMRIIKRRSRVLDNLKETRNETKSA